MSTSRSWRRLAAGWLGTLACTLAVAQMDTPAPPGPPAAQSVQRPPAKTLPASPPAAASASPLKTLPPTHPGDPQISVPLGKPAPPPGAPSSAPVAPPPPAADLRGESMASCDRLSGKAAVAECRRRVATQGSARPTPP